MKRSVIEWSLLLVFVLTITKVNASGWIKEVPYMKSITYNQYDLKSYTIAPSTVNGFFLLTNTYDSTLISCGTDSCFKTGLKIIRYDNNGKIVWNKYFFPDTSLLNHDIPPGGTFVSYTNYTAHNIYNCADNSGIIVNYTLDQNTWVSGSEIVPTSYWLKNFYAKFDYDGNVIWSQKEITNNIFSFNSFFPTDQIFPFSEYVYFTYQDDMNSTNLDFTITHKYYNYNMDSVATDIDTFNHIFFPDTASFRYINCLRILRTSDGGMLLLLLPDDGLISLRGQGQHPTNNMHLLKLNANNEMEWLYKTPYASYYNSISNLIEVNNRYYVMLCDGYLDNTNVPSVYTNGTSKLFSINVDGNNAIERTYQNDMKKVHLRDVNNTLQLIGISNGETDGNNDNHVDYSIHFFQFDNNDSATIIKEVKMPPAFISVTPKTIYEEQVIDLKNGSSVFGFRYEYINDNYTVIIPIIINIDSIGNVYPVKISGTIYGDKNNNCLSDSTDAYLRNYALRIINSSDSFYTSTDTLGNYEIYLDSGNYQLQLLPNPSYPLWKLQDCTVPSNIHLNINDSAKIDIGLTPIISCTNLTVSLTSPMLRRCFENTYYINYCNNGTINANNAYIDVTLDPNLDFNTSSQTFTNLGNNIFRFIVGNVETGKCGASSFTATVNCDSTILGQTHCTEAHIFPDTVCLPVPYNGAIIKASALCKTNKVEFKLKNIGGNMQSYRKYIVIQDQVLRSIQNYNLPSGNELIIEFPLDSMGSTYRIEAEQPVNFPPSLGNPKVAAFIEGCGANANDTFTTGVISQFPLFDGEPYRAIDCQQNIGSYDPNDKNAKPTGVGTEHFIDKNIPLEYTIRFQNTGNDTAFSISIIDEISPWLDINTIALSASSHHCDMIRIDTNVIQFLFKDIKLVDSVTNEKASHGFVQFHIQQKENNAVGTIISNMASIYFDYNPAIKTNLVYHTIGENYLSVDLISTSINQQYKGLELITFPNPFNDKTTLQIKNAELKNPKLILLDINGKLEQVIDVKNKNQIVIYKDQLNVGLYIYKLMDENIEVASGKIIVQ